MSDVGHVELRVLGCLIEKQRTTPDQYPLSLNALRLACNQATNRDPVVDYDEHEIRTALHHLGGRGWTRLASGPSSRVAKYRHLFDEAISLDGAETALLALLMLRGPQTVGELKNRSERLHHFADLEEVAGTLDRLAARELVAELPRRPGQKEQRWTQLLADDGAATTTTPAAVHVEEPDTVADEPGFPAVIDTLLEHNRAFAARYSHGHLDVRPSLRLAIVTCMDSRLDVFAALGLDIGQAHVLRNAGGVITDDVIRSLAISQRRLGTEEITLIHHTDCGLQLVTDDGFRAELQQATGMAPSFAIESFTDVDADVRQSIVRVRHSPFLLHRDHVRGYVYDVDTGVLREVAV